MSTQPLLPTHRPTRRLSTGKGKGKAPALPSPSSSSDDSPSTTTRPRRTRGAFMAYDSDSDDPHHLKEDSKEEIEEEEKGRCVTVRFTGDSEAGGGDLDVWVEEGESVGSVKDKLRVLRPSLQSHTLRFIHSGRLLTDGILLLPWLRALEHRLQVRQEAEDMGIAGVVRGLAGDGDDHAAIGGKGKGKMKEEKVWVHCVVGAKAETKTSDEPESPSEEAPPPNRRGFDSLLDAGFTPQEIAAMRREFYLSRGQEVPDEFIAGAAGGAGGAGGDAYEEHVRALEEQWIEGDLNNETAQTVNEGLYSSILHGILIGFLLPLLPWFFFRELPSPNFFDPLEGPDAPPSRLPVEEDAPEDDDAEGTRDPSASRAGNQSTTTRETHAEPLTAASMFGLRGLPGGDWRTGVVFGQRTQMAILIGTILNVGFAGLRFLA